MLDFLRSNKRSLLILILVNLTFFVCIVVGDLKTMFESYAVLLLEWLFYGQIIFSAILLSWLLYKSVKQKAGYVPFLVLALGVTAFMWPMPGFAVKLLAPLYDSYYEQKARTELARIIPLYQEPAYLPPQIKLDTKEIVTILWDGYARIKTTYHCIHGYQHHTIRVELLSSIKDEAPQDHGRIGEIIKINGEDIFYYDTGGVQRLIEDGGQRLIEVKGGGQHLILDSETFRREVYVPEECNMEKKDMIKIMESLQPAEYKDAVLRRPEPKQPDDREFD